MFRKIATSTTLAISMTGCTLANLAGLAPSASGSGTSLTPPTWLQGTWKSSPGATNNVVVVTANDVTLDGLDQAKIASAQNSSDTSYSLTIGNSIGSDTFTKVDDKQIDYKINSLTPLRLYKDGNSPIAPPSWLQGTWQTASKILSWTFTGSSAKFGTTVDEGSRYLSQTASDTVYTLVAGTEDHPTTYTFTKQADGSVQEADSGMTVTLLNSAGSSASNTSGTSGTSGTSTSTSTSTDSGGGNPGAVSGTYLQPPSWLVGTWEQNHNDSNAVVVTPTGLSVGGNDYSQIGFKEANSGDSYSVSSSDGMFTYKFDQVDLKNINYTAIVNGVAIEKRLYKDGNSPIAPPTWLHGSWKSGDTGSVFATFTANSAEINGQDVSHAYISDSSTSTSNTYTLTVDAGTTMATQTTYTFTWNSADNTVVETESGLFGTVSKNLVWSAPSQ